MGYGSVAQPGQSTGLLWITFFRKESSMFKETTIVSTNNQRYPGVEGSNPSGAI